MIRPRRTKFRPIVEGLDDRCLPSVAGLTPAQVATAYGLSGLTFGTRAANGSGQKIAIVDAYNDPNIKTELAVFDSAFNLPRPPSLTVVGQTGTSALPSNDAVWALEEALDVEWAHALAPGAGIVLVEANSASVPDLMAAVNVAKRISGVSVIAMSWGASEFSGETAYDSVFTTPGVTFVAGSGDYGRRPPVAGLVPQRPGGRGDNTPSQHQWKLPGRDRLVRQRRRHQHDRAGTQLSSLGPVHRRRSTPDVAFDADPTTGVPIYSQGSWITVGGTSLGTAAWAGIIAIVDQGRALANEGTLGSTQTLTALYSLPSSAFHTVGGAYNTQTGLGSPNGAALVNDLVRQPPKGPPERRPSSQPCARGPLPEHHLWARLQPIPSGITRPGRSRDRPALPDSDREPALE